MIRKLNKEYIQRDGAKLEGIIKKYIRLVRPKGHELFVIAVFLQAIEDQDLDFFYSKGFEVWLSALPYFNNIRDINSANFWRDVARCEIMKVKLREELNK